MSKKRFVGSFIIISAVMLILSATVVSLAAWESGVGSVNAVGSTGYIEGIAESVGNLTVTPKQDTYTRDEDGVLHMQKLYPVDHLGDGPKQWVFTLKATDTADKKFKFTVHGSATINGEPTRSVALYYSLTEITDPLNPQGRPLDDGISDIFVADGVTETTVYIYITANSTQAMNAEVSLSFGISARVFEGIYNLDQWDMSKITADDPAIIPLSEQDIVVYSIAQYNDVTASILLKASTSAQGDGRTQGIMFKFAVNDNRADDRVIFVRAHYEGSDVCLQRMHWDGFDNYVFDEYDEDGWSGNFYTFDEEEKAAYLGDGIRFTALRSGNAIYYYIGNKLACVRDGESTPPLDSGYGDKEVRVGFFGAQIIQPLSFRIYEGAMPIEFNDETSADAHGNVITDKQSYTLNDKATVTVVPENGYIVDSLIINGDDVCAKGQNGKYSFYVVPTVSVKATFRTAEYITVSDLGIVGRKKNVNSALNGEIKLTNINGEYDLTVADGKIYITPDMKIAAGTYTLSANGYLSREVSFTSGMTDGIVLEYKLFASGGRVDMSVYNDDNWDISKMNDDPATITPKHSGDIVAYSEEYFDDVTASLRLKKSATEESENTHGIMLMFDNGDAIFLRSHIQNEKVYLQRMPWKDFNDYVFKDDVGGWSGELYEFSTAEQDLYSNDGVNLTVARRGRSLYCYIGGKLLGQNGTFALDEKYEGMKVRVGLFGSRVKESLTFDITPSAAIVDNTEEPVEQTGGENIPAAANTSATANTSFIIKHTSLYIDEQG